MKNTIFLVIDSLNYTRVSETDRKLMPFLRSLEDKYVSCENMFSQAPYTEAAVQSLYCGQNVLDNGGYIERYNMSPKTIFEVYKENGYDVYYNSFQPQCFPSSLRRGVTDIYNSVGFELSALWHYRLLHYSNLKELDEIDKKQLVRLFDDNLYEWKKFLTALVNKDKEVELIIENAPAYKSQSYLKFLNRQIEKYELNKLDFINGFLEKGLQHDLFKIPYFSQYLKIKDPKINDQINEVLTPTFLRIDKLNKKLNFKNNHVPFGKIFKLGLNLIFKPCSDSVKQLGKAFLSTLNAYTDPDLLERITNPGVFKNAPSLEKHINHFYNWLDDKKSDNPYFACIHVDDIHSPEEFFSYDTDNIDRIKQQAKTINNYLDSLDKNFCGSITHDLSLIHIDNVIKEIFEELEKRNELDNTTVYIMADHGFAFSYNPIRTTFGIDFFLENYRIPFVMVDKSLEHKRVTELHESKDIPLTALKMSGLTVPENFTGKSVLEEGYDILGIEYCGSGCPDLRRRQLMFGAFDGRELIGLKQGLFPTNAKLKISEYYDLVKDPKQKHCKNPNKLKNDALTKYIIDRRTKITEYVLRNQHE